MKTPHKREGACKNYITRISCGDQHFYINFAGMPLLHSFC